MSVTLASLRARPRPDKFVGRTREQRAFRDTLRHLAAQRGIRDEQFTALPDYPLFFLVAAEGGMGKSTLLTRFKAIVAEDAEQAGAVAVLVNLEGRGSIDTPERLMRRLHDELCDAGFDEQLRPYRQALQRRDEVQKKAADAEERFKSRLADLAGGAVQLATGGAVSDTWVASGIHAGAESLAKLREYIRSRLEPEEWQLYDDPDDDPSVLAEAFMEGVRAIALPQRPLVLMIDTYELADRCDRWLRKRLLPISSLRTVWVLAGREGKAFVNRYQDEPSPLPELLFPILLDAFARSEIEAYLRACGIAAPDETLVENLQALSRGVPIALEGWYNLYQQHVELPPPDPLAPTNRREIVRKVTERFLLYCNEDAKDLREEERQKRTETRHTLYSLMVLRRTEREALSAAWGCDAAQTDQRLADLSDRFSFVFADPIEREPHALVREFLREYLRMQPIPAVVHGYIGRMTAYYQTQFQVHEQELQGTAPVSPVLSIQERVALQKLRDIYLQRLHILERQIAATGEIAAEPGKLSDRDQARAAIAKLEAQLNAPSVQANGLRAPLWQDEQWRTLQLDLLNLLAWQDRTGRQMLHRLIPLWIEALAFHRASALELLTAVEEFSGSWSLALREAFELLLRARTSEGTYSDEPEIVLPIIERLRESADTWRLTTLQRAILELERGKALLKQGRQDATQRERALVAADATAALLAADGGELREQLGIFYSEIGRSFLWKGLDVAAFSTESLIALQQTVRLMPEDKIAWYDLGVSYSEHKRYAEAEIAYYEVIRLEPTWPFPHHGLGNIYREQYLHKEAEEAYQKAIRLESTWTYPHYGLGKVYHDKRRYEEAEAEYCEAIRLNPTWPFPYHGLGDVYRDQRRYEEAEKVYRKAIYLDPSYVYPYYGLGYIYREQQRYTEAEAAYTETNRLNPNNGYSHIGLGNVYRDQQRYAEAEVAYQEAIRLDSSLAVAYDNLGHIYSIRGQLEEARKAYQRSYELAPSDPSTIACLARIERQTGNQAEADALIMKARSLPLPDSDYNRACLESIAGNTEAALELLQTALNRDKSTITWARQDPDFVFIRDDPRFRQLVGEAE